MNRVVWSAAVLSTLLIFAPPVDADIAAGRAAYEAGDFERALANWKPLAERGDRDAILHMGILHERGEGVPKDRAEAHKWYVLAWKRSVAEGRTRALAIRKEMTEEEFAASRTRIRSWLTAFAAKKPAPSGSKRGDLGAFYPKAHTRSQSPLPESRLRTLCKARVEGQWVTFVTADGKTVLLASLTPGPLRDPSKDIYLNVRYTNTMPPSPRAAPATGTADWAYVYDRNRDGRVDYCTYLDGPYPVIPDPRTAEVNRLIKPTSISKRAGDTAFGMTGEQLKFWINHVDFAFFHMADDDFDGALDGYGIPTRVRGTMWLDGYLLMRSTRFDGRFDACRYVATSKGTPATACRQVRGQSSVPGRHMIGFNTFPPEEEYPYVRLVNVAARKCGLTSRHFRSQ